MFNLRVHTLATLMLVAVFSACLTLLSGCSDKKKLTLTSPDGTLQVQLNLDAKGRAFYTVLKNGQTLLNPSQLGLKLNTGEFVEQLTLTDVQANTVKDNYRLVAGKRRDNNYLANEKIISLKNAQGKKLAFALRVSNDAVAFQYRILADSQQEQRVQTELTQFALPAQSSAWLQPIAVAQTGWANTNPSYEEHYAMNIPVGTPSSSPAGWIFPALFKVNDTWVLLTEAGISADFHASRLQANSDNGIYTIAGPQDAERISHQGVKGALVAQAKTNFHSPWRIILAGGLDTIIASSIGTDLADPAGAAMEFVKPGIAAWSWALLKDDATNYTTQVEFIDYAAKMGWPYALIDAEWDKRIGYEKLSELVSYAQVKKVGIWVWYNSSGDWNTTPMTPKSVLINKPQRRAEFLRLQKMGIKGVKIDFFPGDGQSVMAYYHELLTDAADFNLMVNFHGTTLPRGLQRTYPNLLTAEAVHGFEMITFNQSSADKAASHIAMLPFTRNAFDPMDFTPTTFGEIPNITRRTSNGFELALPFLLVSGVQHMAEIPANMAKVPNYVQEFLQDIPVAWDESRLLAGFPGEYVVIARRRGEQWFIAGINAKPTDLAVPLDLSFTAGKNALFITDGKDARSFYMEQWTDLAGKIITLKANGGFVLKTQ